MVLLNLREFVNVKASLIEIYTAVREAFNS